ncbi:MAG: hypothetical protein RLZZ383_2911 [Pseudomonadota bacterium]|jgi:hypothetical protein
MTVFDELYVMARRVLLDVLGALGDHRGAIVLVGAQAVYLRVGDADLAVTPYTTDGDLVVDPAVLTEIPPLERALLDAGFSPKTNDSVGVWLTTRKTSQQVEAQIAVDLLVPASVSPGTGRRAARLPGHDTRAARIVHGLEGAIVDAEVMTLTALEDGDARTVDVRVAGPAALLVAKVHKIDDRKDSDRQSDKDALDVLRLLRGTETEDLASRYARLLSDPRSADAAQRGRELLQAQFARRQNVGVQMAIRSAGVLGDADNISVLFEALVGDLLTALR